MRIETIHLQETDSTNNYLRGYKQEAGAEMTVAVAEYQYSGKGQGCNSWESERGKNLLFSILFRPGNVRANGQFVISMAVSVAVRDAFAAVTGGGISIKWPNDIYAGNKKICGILIENRLSGSKIKDCVIGIGINVNQTRFVSSAPNPVSLKMLTGKEHDTNILLDDILGRFCILLNDIKSGGGNIELIRREYKKSLFRRDGYHLYRDKDGTFEAEIYDTEDDGHLLLRDRNGKVRRYAFKEVTFLIRNDNS